VKSYPALAPFGFLAVTALVALIAVARPTPLHSQALDRVMFVSVVDQTGAPVPDLGPGDFVVREDNLAREVLRVAPADDPMQIALLVDNSTAARDDVVNIRRALPTFLDSMMQPVRGGRNQIALIALAERPTILSDYTFDRAQLGKATDRLWEQSMSGNYLLDGLMEVTGGFKRREALRPVILAFTTEGPELSTARYQSVLEALAGSNAAFHVISLGTPSVSRDDASVGRDIVVDQGTMRTGGMHERLLTSMSLAAKLQQVANVLNHEYRVTYAHPDSLIPPDKVTVSVRKANLTARGRLAKTQTSTIGPQARP